MLRLPRIVERRARFVGMQVLKDEERFRRSLF